MDFVLIKLRWLLIGSIILEASCGFATRIRNDKIYRLVYEGRNDELIALYKKDLETGQHSGPDVYLGLHSAYLCKPDYHAAKRYLLEGLRHFPEDGHIMWNAGMYYAYIENLCDKGLEFLLKAKEVYKTSDWKLLIDEEIRHVENLSEEMGGEKHCKAKPEDYLRLICVTRSDE